MDFVQEWKNDDLIQPRFGPHSLLLCPVPSLRRVAKSLEQVSAGFHMHLAETVDESLMTRKEYGVSAVRLLHDLGLLEFDAVLAHGSWVEQQDLELLAKHGVSVALCPVSNLALGTGLPPLREYLSGPVSLGIGTDGASSVVGMDMFATMRTLWLLCRGAIGDSTDPLLARQIFGWATRSGAKLLGKPLMGLFEVGAPADFVLARPTTPWFTFADPYFALMTALNSTDVETVLVAGTPVVVNKSLVTVDVEEMEWEFRRRRQALFKTARPFSTAPNSAGYSSMVR